MIGLDREATRRYVLLVVFTGVLALVGAAATIAFLAQINAAIAGKGADLPHRTAFAGGLMVLATGAGYASQVLLVRVNFGLAHDIRMSVARSVAYAPLEAIDTFGVQRILTILIDDVRSLIDFVGFLPNFVPSVLMVLAGLAYLLHLDLLIGGVMVLGVFGLFIVGARATLNATQVMLKGRMDDEGLRQTISQLVYGAKEVKLNAHRRDRLVERDIRRLSRSAADNYIRCMHMYRSYDELVKLTYFGFFLAALAYGVTHPHFGVAGTGAVIIIFFFLQNPIQLTNFVWERIAPCRIAYGKLSELHGLMTATPEPASQDREGAFDGWSEIRLDGVRFTYPATGAAGDRFEIGPIETTIRRGELIFIKGENGAGKTTLSKLLSGLYRPTGGAILVDGQPVSEANVQAYRELFTVLFADKYLFEEVCPAPGVTEADVEAWLAELQIADKVSLKDWRFSTIALSTGQRDRLALADSIAQRRPIAIFDEWAANQDPASRARFYQTLLPRFIASGQTVIVISHDDRYYHRADRLWSVENGRLVQETQGVGAQP